MRTIVYIDGFNLYYGVAKNTPHKWIDLGALFRNLLSAENEITKIRYFTAKVSARPSDPDIPIRQMVYLNALSAYVPHLEITLGNFKSTVITAPLVTPINGQRFAKVHKTEEKGSDVNLAVHLVNDAWRDAFDCAAIVSNDSDLAEALRIVKVEHKKKIILLTPGDPHDRWPNTRLSRYASKTLSITAAHVAAAQLPNLIPGTTIHKPKAW